MYTRPQRRLTNKYKSVTLLKYNKVTNITVRKKKEDDDEEEESISWFTNSTLQPTFSTKRATPPPQKKIKQITTAALGLHPLQIQTQAQELDFYFFQTKSLTFWKIVSF